MAEQEWSGKSGAEYTFEVYKIDSNFNDRGCVYIYSSHVAGGWVPVYVGQTAQLQTRMSEHANNDRGSDSCIQRSGATHIHVCWNNSESIRLAIETDIRNNYQWKCNRQ